MLIRLNFNQGKFMQKVLFLGLIALSLRAMSSEEACRVQMDDSRNKFTTTLSVTKHSETEFEVTDHDNYISAPWTEFVYITEEGRVWGDAGVPGDFEIEEFKKIYKMEDDSQLTWTILSGDCDELKKAMIYYMVAEWFYFG
jgi:hypothetical protein